MSACCPSSRFFASRILAIGSRRGRALAGAQGGPGVQQREPRTLAIRFAGARLVGHSRTLVTLAGLRIAIPGNEIVQATVQRQLDLPDVQF